MKSPFLLRRRREFIFICGLVNAYFRDHKMNVFFQILLYFFFCLSFLCANSVVHGEENLGEPSLPSPIIEKPSKPVSPFTLSFPPKENMTHEDYEQLQKELRTINIGPLLQELYVKNQGYTHFEEFERRCTRGIKQTIIDREKGWLPVKELVKVGTGGDMCIVTCSGYDGKYPGLVKSLPKAFEECGFNGYFYYRIGGFPNPTGKEIQYAATPYCFKIFLMLEAQKLGFTKVLWLDSSMLPVKDPTPLFELINSQGCFLCHFINHPYERARIFPKTRQLFHDMTGVDVVSRKHFTTQALGLKMDAEKTKNFIKEYYRFVELGTPFLSCFPEEFVFASIFLQQEKEWPTTHYNGIMMYAEHKIDPAEEALIAKKRGVYFYLRAH